jgi:hypothetical protein
MSAPVEFVLVLKPPEPALGVGGKRVLQELSLGVKRDKWSFGLRIDENPICVTRNSPIPTAQLVPVVSEDGFTVTRKARVVAAKEVERAFDGQGHFRAGIRVAEFVDDKIDNFREAARLQCGVRSCLGDAGRV